MSSLISFSPTAAAVPAEIEDVVARIEAVRAHVRATFTDGGGINRSAVVSVLEPIVREAGFRSGSEATLSPREIDFSAPSLLAALSVQAGRAATNNGGLLATLAAASCEDIDWLVLLVPEQYKASAAGVAVQRQLRDLAVAHGVRLELQGVLLVQY